MEDLMLTDIDEKQIPDLISKQFAKMAELHKEIEIATNNAYDAKEAVINEVTTGTQGNKAAIESLQSATLNLANAQVDAMRAQRISFEYQQKLTEISKYLFRLGLTNIAMNRVVVEELEMRLRQASQEELDELARNEIESLLRRLKAQQDIDKRQSELSELVKEQHIATQEQEREILAQAEKDIEHDRRLDELFAITQKQGTILRNVLMEISDLRNDLYEKDLIIKKLSAKLAMLEQK